MITLYTMTFADFLKKHGDSTEWQAVKTKFEQFPNFTLGNMNLKMYDLLVEKYDIWEIGSEDENIFYHEFNEKVNELLIKYVPKIESYIASFSGLLQRKINLSQGGSTMNYLYPVSTQQGKISNEVRYDGNKDSLLLIFKSNAELLTQVMNLKDIYLDCLEEFSRCFMTIY